jgi:hypothetical protein
MHGFTRSLPLPIHRSVSLCDQLINAFAPDRLCISNAVANRGLYVSWGGQHRQDWNAKRCGNAVHNVNKYLLT